MSREVELRTAKKSLLSQYLHLYLIPTIIGSISDLDEFLEENVHLFTLTGVFGGITVYLDTATQKAGYTDVLNYAIFSGFALIILISIVIFIKLVRIIGWRLSTVVKLENLFLIGFGVFYLQIVALIFGLLSQFDNILFTYAILVLVLVGEVIGIFSSFFSIKAVNKIASHFGRFSTPLKFIGYSIVFMLGIAAAAVLLEFQPMPGEDVSRTLIDWAAMSLYYSLSFFLLVYAVLFVISIIGLPLWSIQTAIKNVSDRV
ncbi:hypothetical protein ACFQDG_02980 [Natronoarchaeum mannanilyticum]|uniref:hypothetical protein n=1 Tax=Natronoarchaeum mannanilyticum TaxID=926360 RepID=UPI0031D51A22